MSQRTRNMIDALKAALRTRDVFEAQDKVKAVLADAELRTWATQDEVERARNEYGSDDVAIDDDAESSITAPAGVWVQAWVWLDDEDGS